MLIMCAIEKFFPEMIDEGRLCWLRTPLYIVTNGKKNSYYFTDTEFNEAKEKDLIKGQVNRAKGIGALPASQVRESMFGKYQRMDILDSNHEAIQLLRNLMGKDIKFRKQYIFENVDFKQVKE